ncbi:MAG: hypothetical protein HY909_08930 [Deltaproteobacteria bacterium]|nr:hypothetical protein [Deltaproteobacteria bacterium]
MIAPGTRIEGFDARSWHRLVTLVAPGFASQAPHARHTRRGEPGGALLVFFDDDRAVCLHSHRGALPTDGWEGPSGLEAFARRWDTRFAVALRVGAWEALLDRVAGRMLPGDDGWTTLTQVLGAARELEDEGSLALLPKLGAGVPLPPTEVLRRAWDLVLPDGQTAALALFDDGALDTALVLVRRRGRVEQVLGPEALLRRTGPLGGDPRRDYRVIHAALEASLPPVAFGVYASTEVVRALLRGEPGDWARALAVRDVLVHPMPPWLAMTTGASALRGAAVQTRRLLGALEANELLGPFSRQLRGLADLAGALDVRGLLGFDPLGLLASLLRRSRSEPTRDDPGEGPDAPPTR